MFYFLMKADYSAFFIIKIKHRVMFRKKENYDKKTNQSK